MAATALAATSLLACSSEGDRAAFCQTLLTIPDYSSMDSDDPAAMQSTMEWLERVIDVAPSGATRETLQSGLEGWRVLAEGPSSQQELDDAAAKIADSTEALRRAGAEC